MPRLPLVPARRRPRRQLFAPMAAGLAARRIQAAARGFLARRRVGRMRRPLLSPMDIRRMKKTKTQGQVNPNRPGVMPRYRIGSLIGTVKSSRKVKGKMDPLTITEHSDIHATVEQKTVGYWGYSDAGSLDQQLEMGVRALVNMFVRRSGLKPVNIYQQFEDSYLQDYSVLSNVRLARIVIGFQGVDTDGIKLNTEETYDVDITKSIHMLVGPIMAKIKELSQGTSYSPIRAILQSQNTGSDAYDTFATYDLENVMIDFSYMRKYKWQNVTPAVSGYSVNDINANPLSGKIYQFKHHVPQVRAAHLDDKENTQLALIQDFTFGQLNNDGALNTQAFRNGNFLSTLEFPFKQPFKAMEIFKDTVSEDKVYMPPGGYKQLIRKGSKTMNFRRFCQATVVREALPNDNYTRRNPGSTVEPRIGTSTLWGLEPVIRTLSDETVKIATQMETWYTTKARIGKKNVPVVQVNSVTAGSDFATN